MADGGVATKMFCIFKRMSFNTPHSLDFGL